MNKFFSKSAVAKSIVTMALVCGGSKRSCFGSLGCFSDRFLSAAASTCTTLVKGLPSGVTRT